MYTPDLNYVTLNAGAGHAPVCVVCIKQILLLSGIKNIRHHKMVSDIALSGTGLVDLKGVEPSTSAMRTQRSPN